MKFEGDGPIDIGDAVLYPPGTPEYQACTAFERGLMHKVADLITVVEAWQRRAEVAENRVVILRADLAEATARNRRSVCCWCGQEQEHASFEARGQAMIDHTITCPARPEPRLLACVEDLMAALRDAHAALGNLAGAPVAVAWIEALDKIAHAAQLGAPS